MSVRTVKVDGTKVRQLRLAAGWSQEDLAARADVVLRMINRIEAGRAVMLDTLRRVADAFSVELVTLLAADLVTSPSSTNTLNVLFHIPGDPTDLRDHKQIDRGLNYAEAFARNTPKARVMVVVGVNAVIHAAPDALTIIDGVPALPPMTLDDVARVISFVYGMVDNTKPFWCYVAVKPTQYQRFLDAVEDGTLNLHEFKPFGEVIVSGAGHTPPEAVTLKVAEVYQTDPKNFSQSLGTEDVEKQVAAVAKKIQERALPAERKRLLLQ